MALGITLLQKPCLLPKNEAAPLCASQLISDFQSLVPSFKGLSALLRPSTVNAQTLTCLSASPPEHGLSSEEEEGKLQSRGS